MKQMSVPSKMLYLYNSLEGDKIRLLMGADEDVLKVLSLKGFC